MKKAVIFLLAFFLPFVQASGRDKTNQGSLIESQHNKDFLSEPCAQQLVHRESNLWFTITNWGFLGSEARGQWDSETNLPAPSAEFPGGSDLEYLFMGALWIGGVVEGETLVSVGADG